MLQLASEGYLGIEISLSSSVIKETGEDVWCGRETRLEATFSDELKCVTCLSHANGRGRSMSPFYYQHVQG
jgi:hypothetical protein